ncbi:RNA polymerase sigma factor [Haloferula chungangensis]|uniref:RNA polymerase sigma factor n=1 Tax=Haloferula chungangensis TaxID=1048331 RepID=A0ABW2LDI0_9BACT
MRTDHTDDDGNLDLQRGFLKLMPELKGWFCGMVSDRSLVDDLVQETFLTVIKKQDSFEAGTNFRAWVFAIARFKLLNVSRLPSARETCLSENVLEVLFDEEAEEENWDDRAEFLPRCLAKLAPRAREVIELRYFSDLTPTEISDKIHWSRGAVNVALTRARQLLEKCIETEHQYLKQQSSNQA